jgi:UDP-glucose 4-epimerase
MKKALVTGGAGFIGSNLVDELLKQEYEVIVIDNESSKSRTEYYWNKETKNYNFDLSSVDNLYKLTEICREVDYVFHMAADVSIPYCVEHPDKSYTNNVNGLLYVLEASRKANVSRLVFSSTSAIYGLTEKVCIETDKPDPLNPYSHSKYAGEQLVKMYCDLYGFRGVCLRYFNVYGNRQPTTGQYAPVIGIFQTQKNNNQALTIVGDGHQTRDFVHVSDVVSANIAVATKDVDVYGEVYNVGSAKNYSIRKIANMISDKQVHIPPRPAEARMSLANINKIKHVYGWSPKVQLEEWMKTL